MAQHIEQQDDLGRAVLAALDRLERRMDQLEERLTEASLGVTSESSSVGPSTSLGNMLEDVLVKLYQIESRVDSVEKRQETAREEKEQRRSDKRRAATTLLRQQGYAVVVQRPTAAIAPLRSVAPPRPPAKRPPSLPRSVSAVAPNKRRPAQDEEDDYDDDYGDEDARHARDGYEYDVYDAEGESGVSAEGSGGEDETGTTQQQQQQAEQEEEMVSPRKPLPAFPASGRRAVTAYLPLSQSSELLLQLAEMELQERQIA